MLGVVPMVEKGLSASGIVLIFNLINDHLPL